jgi:protein tyrosine/serine phosphatase
MRHARSLQVAVLATAALFALMAVRCGGEEPVALKPEVKAEEKPAKAEEKPAEPKERDPRWAAPLTKPGLPNLHKVSDALYRGAQPEPAGFAQLKQMGIKTIVNLRYVHSDRDDIKEAGLAKDDFNYFHIRMHAWNAKDNDIVAFLKVMADEQNHPVFVHCQHGADRTGTMSAVYRIAFQDWTVEQALKEMVYGGFGFHEVWVNLIDYLKNVDMERLEREAGITE